MLSKLVTLSLVFMIGCSASPAFAFDPPALDAALDYLASPGLVGRDLALAGTPTFAAGVVLLLKPLLVAKDFEAYVRTHRAAELWGRGLSLGGGLMVILGTGLLLYRAHELINGPTPTDEAEKAKVEFLRDFFALPLVRQRQIAHGDDALANFVIDYAEYLRLSMPPHHFIP